MPITIKTGALKYKNAQGGYTGFNAIAQETSEQQIANIQSVGATQVSAVQQKGAETIASIPDDYTALSDDVSELKRVCQWRAKTLDV